MKILQTISDNLFKVEKIMVILLLTIMLSSITFGVVFRYFLNNPLNWSDELAVYTLIWVTFIGGSMSIKTGRAAALELIFERISLKMQKVFLFTSYAIVTAFSIYCTYLALKWILGPTISQQMSPSLGITMFYPYLSVPVGLLFITIHSLNHCAQSLVYESKAQSADGKESD